MITHFGWADTALNPMMSVNYYKNVEATLGVETTSEFYRLFMVPGMFHCTGGLGTDRFDAMTPLINWVESGSPPDLIPAARVEAGGADERWVVRGRRLGDGCVGPRSCWAGLWHWPWRMMPPR